MKKVLTIICWALWFGMPCMPAQTASDLNAGLVISSPVEGQFELSWWGKDGWTYFIEQSDDLIHWHFLPVIETVPAGMGDGILTWGLSTNALCSFFKLRVSNISTEDSHSADFDGDGISNWAELENGTDPLDYYNGILPTLHIVSGGNQWGPVNEVLPEPIAIEVGAGLANAPVVFTSGNAQLSPDGTGNWSNKVIIRSSPNQTITTARVYVKLPSTSNTVSQISAGVTSQGVSSNVTTNASTSGSALLPPTGFFASVLSTTSMRVEWTPTDPTRHTSIEISKDQGATWELLAVVDPGVTTFDVEEMESGKKVLFRLFTGDIRTAMTASAATMPASASMVTALGKWKVRLIEIFYGKSMQTTAPPAGSSPPTKPFGDGPPLVIENVRWEESRQISAEFGEEQGVGYGLYWSEQPWVNLLDPDESGGGIGRDHVEYEQKFRHAVDTFILFPERGWPPEGFRGYHLPSMYSVFCGPYYYYGQVCGSVAGWTQVRVRSDHVLTEEDGPYSKTYLRATWGSGQWNVTSAETLTIPVGKDRSEPATLDPQWVTPFTFENDNGKFYLATPSHNGALIPVVISWEKVGDNWDIEDNKDFEGNWMPGKGKKFYPDAKAPAPQEHILRDTVTAKVTTGIPNLTLYLKVFDVDDPSDDNIVDGNGKAGDDNFTPASQHSGEAKPPFFGASNSAIVECKTNGDGIAHVLLGALPMMKVGKQPGDNCRVAVALESSELAYLQVADEEAEGYLAGDNDQFPEGFKGVVSPMLTVWRKLNVEVDSMEKIPNDKPGPDHVRATGASWETAVNGMKILHLTGSLPEGNDFYAGGRIKTGSEELKILSHTSTTISVGFNANASAAFIGEIEVFDDDDSYLSNPQLPKPNVITSKIKEIYSPCYIDVIELDAAHTPNPKTSIPFELYTELPPIFRSWDLLASWDSTEFDSDAFWCGYLIQAYQPTPSVAFDPDSVGLREGATSSTGWSIIFVETIREHVAGRIENSPAVYHERLDAIAAHELGHVLGRVAGHPESTGLMKVHPDDDHDFSPETILRFRKQPRWPQQ